MSLKDAAEVYFLDTGAFLTAFDLAPHTAIVTLRDNPAAYGRLRTYLGAYALHTAHAKLLTAARRAWKARDPNANVHATHMPRIRSKQP